MKFDVRHVHEIVGEIILDHITLVAQTNHEVIYAVGRVDLEDAPQDRLPADFYHRFWADGCFFNNTCAHAASEDDCFHAVTPCIVDVDGRSNSSAYAPAMPVSSAVSGRQPSVNIRVLSISFLGVPSGFDKS